LHQHWEKAGKKEEKNVVSSGPVVINLFREPEILPGFILAQPVEDGSKQQRKSQENICHPEVAAEVFVKIFVVALETIQHQPSNRKKNYS